MTDAPDYTTMSGADFQQAVGADPEKWAVAFSQTHLRNSVLGFDNQELARWFRDAMDAAIRHWAHDLRHGPLPP